YQMIAVVRPKKKISQTLLAKELGVSQALVSLALNGRSVGINPDTYKRIWDRAISLGYLPKGMRVESTPDSSRAKQIGYILRAPRVVAVSARYPGPCHSVLGNEPEALTEVVRHLFNLGHQRIGWLGGNASLGRHDARLAALKAALEPLGLKLGPRYTIVLQQADRAEGAEAIHAMLKHERRKD